MPQPIIFHADAGLVRGIEGAGNALGQALQYRALENKRQHHGSELESIFSKAMKDEAGNPKKLSVQDYLQIVAQAQKAGVPDEMLAPYSALLSGVLKEQTKAEGVNSFFNQRQPGQPPSASQGFPTDPPAEVSPIGMVKSMSNIDPSAGSVAVQTPHGTFQSSEFVDLPGFGKVHPGMISLALRDPRDEVRRWGEGAQKAMLAKEEKERKVYEKDREYHTKLLTKTREKVDGLRESLPKKKTALSLARSAVESKQIGAFSKDRLANVIGGPIGDALRTGKGAQLITAAKENLLSNMSRVSARGQNMWFEQRLNSMFAQIGQKEEANLTVQEMLEGEVALDDAYLKKFDELWDEDVQKYGYAREDLQRRVYKAIEPIEKEIMGRTSYRLKQIEEQEKGISSMRKEVGKAVEKGTPLTLKMAQLYIEKFKDPNVALQAAQKNGYTIPTAEQTQKYMLRQNEFMESQ